MQIHRHGGWKQSPEEYLERVYLLDDKAQRSMLWASPQDWMCEPDALKATGLSVEQHQQLTIENYLELKVLDKRGLIIPVLQGWELGDHLVHVEMYRAAGVDLAELPLVGVGTICRRQRTSEIRSLVTSLYDVGIKMHGFGVKSRGLGMYSDMLVSADSMAWAFMARMDALGNRPRPCGDPAARHVACTNCYQWAHMWYEARSASC